MRGLIIFISLLLLSGCSLFNTEGKHHLLEEDRKTTLKVLYGTSEIGSESVIDAARQYEQLTGLQVEINTFSYEDLQGKVISELAQKSDTYDLIAVDATWIPQIIQYIEPLSPYLLADETALADLNDFIPTVLEDASIFNVDAIYARYEDEIKGDLSPLLSAGFELYSLPIYLNAPMGTYRKDLFSLRTNKEQYQALYGVSLEPPTTMEQYLQIAKFFSNREQDGMTNMYGTTLLAAQDEANMIEFASMLASYGGSLFDADLEPTFQQEAGVKALEEYISWINKYKVTPPDVLSYSWQEAAIVFGSGQTAMSLNYHKMDLNPSIRTGELGYFLFPATEVNGKMQQGPLMSTWGLSINRYSAHKQEAYELLQHLTSRDVQQRSLRFKHHVTRASAFEAAAELIISENRQYYDVLGQSVDIASLRPRVPHYNQISNAIQSAVRESITGQQKANIALEQAAKQVKVILMR